MHREELRATAREHKVRVVLDVDDTGAADRPGLLRVLQAASEGEVAVVLILSLDQLGDSAADVLEAVRAIRRVGCRLVVTSQGLDVPAEGELSDAMVTMLTAISQLYCGVAQRRERRRAASVRRAGKRFGPRPDANAPDPTCVRDMRRMGCSWGQIARRLRCTREAARRAFVRAS